MLFGSEDKIVWIARGRGGTQWPIMPDFVFYLVRCKNAFGGSSDLTFGGLLWAIHNKFSKITDHLWHTVSDVQELGQGCLNCDSQALFCFTYNVCHLDNMALRHSSLSLANRTLPSHWGRPQVMCTPKLKVHVTCGSFKHGLWAKLWPLLESPFIFLLDLFLIYKLFCIKLEFISQSWLGDLHSHAWFLQ